MPNATAGKARFSLITLLLLSSQWLAPLAAAPEAPAPKWQAGAATVDITPKQAIWMSGYAGRSKPAESTLTKLWAKALVIEDSKHRRAVLITMDLIGIDRITSQRICATLKNRYGFERDRIALSTSHTHTGPVVGNNLATMYFLDEQQKSKIAAYTLSLEKSIVQVVGRALKQLEPCQLSWGSGKTEFAVNRRNNPERKVPQLRKDGKLKGPVDHDVPVLAVRSSPDKRLKAVVFGYACHATVLSFFQWSGDYPGFAQIELQKKHPNTVAMFWAGCGADINPLPRRKVELAKEYGHRLAQAVNAVLDAPMRSIGEGLATQYDQIDLAFAKLPDREQMVSDTQSANRFVASRAKHLLKQFDLRGKLDATYPYPIQVWKLGPDVKWVFLGGEVVVDFALKLKQQVPASSPQAVWVTAYSNDVMAYIPSVRVLTEGGYEGGGAMVYYGLPSPWAPQVESRIIEKVLKLAQ